MSYKPECPHKGGWPTFLGTDKSREAYRLYLLSDSWKIRRQGALKRANYKCSLCPSTARLNVHHITYRHIGREWPEDLRVLCEPCHEAQHKQGFTPIPQPEIVQALERGRHLCQATTKRGSRCPIEAQVRDPETNRWLCHVHNPLQTYQRQVAEKRGRWSVRKKMGRQPRKVCAHCGNRWNGKRHKAICERFGLDKP